jgi:hypothetical protein
VLKVDPDPTFTKPVKFKTPQGEQSLLLVFRHMTVEEHDKWWAEALQRYRDHVAALDAHMKALQELAEGAEPPEAPKQPKTGLDEIMDVVVGWEEVDQPFSREALAKVLSNYHDLSAKKICEAWSSGLTQATVEN